MGKYKPKPEPDRFLLYLESLTGGKKVTVAEALAGCERMARMAPASFPTAEEASRGLAQLGRALNETRPQGLLEC